MGTSYTSSPASSGFNTDNVINTNFSAIQTALSRALSVYGDSTNGTVSLINEFDEDGYVSP